ncbi:type IV pilus assembly protein PilM [Herbivorax sp. ANBcel31]|uniref:type IV pilus assembly protein PilM n=1 Tax=Herbivorax sp. ANBcel31 TaxID=3069754 RepID=UPI0027B412AC|nr:type IV pilus assembly protein PilM [Herbivorax sp. ANBcel31]MDQ2085287.1 type IV pilus assembly protein PilM [Herbivorax sp. ANBcel31]
MNKKIISIDIGSNKIKLVYGYVRKNKLIVKEYAIADTPEDSIEDGKLLDIYSLVDVIKNSLIKKNKIRCKNLGLIIKGTGVIVREIQIPKSTEDEIEKMLEFEVEQYFPIGLENYVLDYRIIDEIENIEGILQRVLIVAVPNNQVDEYMKIHSMLKMEIEAIDIPANVIYKILLDRIKLEKHPKEYAVLDIGAKTTGVYIFSEGKLKFNRILLRGSRYVDESISNHFSVDFKKGEELKISAKNLDEETETGYLESEKSAISSVIKSAMEDILNDVNRFFDFYNSRRATNKLRKIYICGGGSKIKNLDKFISMYFNLPTENLVPDENIIYEGKKDFETFKKDFPFLVSSIGAIIRNR